MKCKHCDREQTAKGLCNKHYQQLRKNGSFLPIDSERDRAEKPDLCTEEGCINKTYAKRVCQKHYMRKYRSKGAKYNVRTR